MNNKGIIGSLIGRSTSIIGTLVFNESLRIDGNISGSVSGGETGRVIVSEKGRVSGSVEVERIEVRGVVEGSIKTNGLFVYAPGIVKGKTDTVSIFVEEGATIFNTDD